MSRAAALAASVLLLAGGAAMLLAGLRAGRRHGVRRLREVLSDPAAKPAEDTSALSALWSHLASGAERAGRGTSLFAGMEQRLDRAGWALRPGELALLCAAAAAVAGVGGAVVGGALPGGLLAAAGLCSPLALVNHTGRRLQRRVEGQLPDVLGQLSASMRAGLSLGQGMEAVAEEGSDPIASQLARVLAETRVGATLEDALSAMAERIGSVDLQWAVRAMVIQQQTGGRLADILDVLADFMREREEVRREVRALTAEGRFSALVLLALPFFVGGVILAIRPSYLLPLFADPRGLVMVAGASVLMTAATVWIRKIVRIEV